MSTEAFANCIHRLPCPFDVQRVERTLEALGEAVSGMPDDARELFGSAFGNSPYLCRLALRERKNLHTFWERGPAAVLEGAIRDAERAHEAADASQAMTIVRSAKQCAALAIALADIGELWDIDAVTRALTRFADASVGGALRFLLREAGRAAGMAEDDPATLETNTGLVILAMGKAGAFELNYSSDLDLVVFYDPERFPFRKKSDARGAAVDLVKGIVRLLGETTADGYVFRVDLRLRPDAGATQIAVSTGAAERYYEEMGQNWERAAFIKARPCAGDRAAAEAFLKKLEPFVWRRSLDFAAIEDIHSIKRQIHAHGGHGPIAAAGHNIKLGRGGIREIEFFVQTQQLILGGRNPSLRSRRTLDALEALRVRGLVSHAACAELAECYRYLRRLEHRLQMVEDEQTHTVPRSETGLAHIACFSGYPDAHSFAQELAAKLRLVQRHYESLFEQAPALDSAGGSLVFTGVEDDPETLGTLAKMGFRDPGHVARAIRGWHHGRIRATRSARARELLTQLMPALLAALAATADPDAAFAQFDRFVSGLPAGIQLFSLFLAKPQLLQLVAAIAGSAPRLAGDLARQPALLDAVLDRGFLNELPSREDLAQLLDGQLAAAKDYESILDATRRFAKEQIFRVGAQLIGRGVTTEDAGIAFTNVAECVIAALLSCVEREVATGAGQVEGGSFCVVAMGRLGGCEMTAASDLDLIFIYQAPEHIERSDGERPVPIMTYYARLAQRFIAALTVLTAEGGLYDVDMRLRPTGNKGPAAISLASFSRYHAKDAWTWERLALTRARVVAGPAALQKKIEWVMREAFTRDAEPAMLAREVREMRDRLAAEFPDRGRWDLKFARGGLVDIEFIAQFLQLRHGRDRTDVLHPNTVAALERLAAAEFLDTQDANTIIAAARLQLALLQILRMSSAGNFNPKEATAGMKALLARAAGADEFRTVEAGLAAAQTGARSVFDRLLPACCSISQRGLPMQVPTSLRSGSGRDALVLLHGIGGCAKVWQLQLDFFADRYTVVAWNMPGYGGSPPIGGMTFPILADVLEALLDTLPGQRIHLVGHSMGGMVAQEFLRQHANRIASVCLYATSPGLAQPETPEAIQAAAARAREFMERRIGPLDRGKSMRDMAESMLDRLLAPDAPDSARVAAVESISSVPPDVYRDAMRCILSFDGTALVPTIRKPTLVIAGGEDRTMTPVVVEAMARQIPGARFEIIPRVGHLANLEDPPAFNRVLSDFLASV